MKLISMTDFVFMLRNRTTSELCKDFPKAFKMPERNGSISDMVKDMLAIGAIQWRLTGEYAKFLKQPLKLEMFVPCDDNGNILKEPKPEDLSYEEYMITNKFEILEQNYKQAKEKVLFEHIKRLSYNPVDKSIELYDYKNNHLFFIEENETIEHLVEYNLQLTPNAIKQFL